ncbi:MAG: hypothetical protein ABIW76_20135 [Fibrobacteria bacterium]
MIFNQRSALWAFPIIFGFLLFRSGSAEPDSFSGSPAIDPDGFQAIAIQGALALEENRPDTALELFMEAQRRGMSKDSLYYFLAEAALTHSALDTAMAFNLSIHPPKEGPFRESVLNQRYRLYTQTGLSKDAEAIADSLLNKPTRVSKKNHEFNILFSSGYNREDNYSATDYPFGTDLGGFLSKGPQYRNRAQLLWPLLQTWKIPWSGGIEYDLIKSYAKDSLDYRVGLILKADNFFYEGVTLAFAPELGKITGTGLVSAYKIESSYLSLSEIYITMIQGGFESEWNSDWGNRFSGFWVSFYQDRSLRTGRGINYSLSLSGILVDPVHEANTQKVLYVDDVTKSKPTHYRDSSFQDTLPSNGISTFLRYTSNTGLSQSSTLSPQGVLTFLPTFGYSFPLPFSFSCEIGSMYALNVYPNDYEWTEAALPDSFAAASAGFRGFAKNKTDGKEYAAVIIQENGGFQEHYGQSPASAKTRLRIDHQLGADFSLRRKLSKWGTISIDGMAKRNWSTLAGSTPIWIPRWDLGVAFKWRRGWNW